MGKMYDIILKKLTWGYFFMNFKELIDRVDILKTVDRLIELYPDQINLKDSYICLMLKLRKMIPSEEVSEESGPLTVYVTHVEDEDESYEAVSGYSFLTNTSYSCEFEPFSSWLSMNVAQPSLDFYGAEDFVAHVLWEMTFVNMDEDIILAAKKSLFESIEECKTLINSSTEGKESGRLIDVNELLEKEEFEKIEEPDWEKIAAQSITNKKLEAKMIGIPYETFFDETSLKNIISEEK